jgi:hypothetical protein
MWPVSFLETSDCAWDNAHTSGQVMLKKTPLKGVFIYKVIAAPMEYKFPGL